MFRKRKRRIIIIFFSEKVLDTYDLDPFCIQAESDNSHIKLLGIYSIVFRVLHLNNQIRKIKALLKFKYS
jgi:hypothetical protein